MRFDCWWSSSTSIAARSFSGPRTDEHLENTHHWVVEGFQPIPPFIPQETVPYAVRQVLEGNVFAFSSIAELPTRCGGSRVLREVRTEIEPVSPARCRRRRRGCALIRLTAAASAQWPDALKERLSTVAHVFANALERKRSDLALQQAYAEVTELKERLELDNEYLRQELAGAISDDAIIAQSPAMRAVLREVRRVAATDSTVLLYGETGTGKELLAEAVHNGGKRKNRLLVRVNCAALPGTLIESELFGREKGAYTGALSREVGRFGTADGGTLFLDEVGELPIELQAKLLRVLETGTFERLGSSRTVKVDVRLIAASNRDLGEAVRENRFRKDLFFRLQVFPIHVPPLRERREDIAPLVWTFVKEFGQQLGKVIEHVPRQSMQALQSYAWPGNVRELRNVIERSMILTDGPTLHDRPARTAARRPIWWRGQPGPSKRSSAGIFSTCSHRRDGVSAAAMGRPASSTSSPRRSVPHEETGYRAEESRPQASALRRPMFRGRMCLALQVLDSC